MRMVILWLSIKAFKGIKNLRIELEGKNAIISGENGSGKTSIYDAFLWLLFGKDSSGASKFDLKPVDSHGDKISGQDVEVEACLEVDGKRITLRRVLHEVWARRNGTESAYDHDETLVWIDDVPVKLEKEYVPYISKLADEETFKLITNHTAFMKLPWQNRRKTLLKASGSDVDGQLLARQEFAGVPDILQGKTPEDAKKRLQEQRKRANSELEAIPARIDELTKTLLPVSDDRLQQATEQISDMEKELAKIEDAMNGNSEAYAQAAALADKRAKAAQAIEDFKRDYMQPFKDAVATAQRLYNSLIDDKEFHSSRESRKSGELLNLNAEIEKAEAAKEKKGEEWEKADAETCPEFSGGTVCPACGQALPYSRIEEAKQAHAEEWHKRHDQRMDEIVADGKRLAAKIESLKVDKAACEKEIQQHASWLVDNRQKIEDAYTAAHKTSLPDVNFSEIPGYVALFNALTAIDDEAEKNKSEEHLQTLRGRKREVQSVIDKAKAVLSQRDQAQATGRRIEELGQQRRTLGDQISGIDRDIDLLGQFVSARCKAMEADINDLFRNVQWQLFEVQQNGLLVDCCKALVNGVDYESTLNNAAKVNAGLEIIRVLSREFGTSVPCFVDNKESVNYVEETGGQMILLEVTQTPLSYTLMEE